MPESGYNTQLQFILGTAQTVKQTDAAAAI